MRHGRRLQLWTDDTELLELAVASDCVCLIYPEAAFVSVDTTCGLHTYRVEARGRLVRG